MVSYIDMTCNGA